jgi:hypothetical protein
MGIMKHITPINRRLRSLSVAMMLTGGAICSAQAALTQLDISYYTAYWGTIHASGLASPETVYLTAFQAKKIGGQDLPGGHPDPFITFCLDIRYNLSEPAYWRSGTFPNPNAGTAPLWQTDGIYRAASLYRAFAGGVNFAGTPGKKEGAALQLAIWEVLYEPGSSFSVSSGTGFYVTGPNTAAATDGVIGRANAMLSSAANKVDHNLINTFWNAESDKNGNPLPNNQDLIGPFIPVPEPATYAAAALLCLPLAVNGIRMLRKRRS